MRISLNTSNKEVTKLINYLKSISKENPFAKQRYIEYPEGVIKFHAEPFNNKLYLTDLESIPPKAGVGKKFLTDLTSKADKFNVAIQLVPMPDVGTMSKDQLINWYKKFGFQGKDIMIRKPKEKLVADLIPQWFKDYSEEQQETYLKNHKNSKLSKTFKKQKEEKQKPKSKPKSEKKEGIKKLDTKDYLIKHGSPTGFKGPETKDQSPTGNIKAERYVSALLDKLATLTEKAIAEGKDVPDYDLCEVQVPGTNLFCEVNLGVPRKLMPQLKGKPDPDSWADKNLEKDSKGEVDSEKAYRKMLQNKGIKVTSKKVPANSLKATQNQLVGSKVAGMTKALEKDPHNKGITAPIFISKDGYVLDGHHRWAAQVGLGIKSGIKDPIMMDAEVVDMTMEELLKLTNDFCEKIGIKPKAGKAAEHSNLITVSDLRKLKVISSIPLEDEEWGLFAKTMKELESNLKKLFPDAELNLADHHLNDSHLHLGDRLNIRISVPTNTGRGPQTYDAYQSSSEYPFKFKPIYKDTAKELSEALLKWFKQNSKKLS